MCPSLTHQLHGLSHLLQMHPFLAACGSPSRTPECLNPPGGRVALGAGRKQRLGCALSETTAFLPTAPHPRQPGLGSSPRWAMVGARSTSLGKGELEGCRWRVLLRG